MNARLTDRMRRAPRRPRDRGSTPSWSLLRPTWPTSPATTRCRSSGPTPLVLRSEHAPTMLVPELNARSPPIARAPGRRADRLDRCRRSLRRSRAAPSVPGARRGRGPALGEPCAGAPARGTEHRARAGVARDRPPPRREGRGRAAALRRPHAAPTRRSGRSSTMPFAGRREEQIAADLADLLVRNGHSRSRLHDRGERPNAASPHHEPGGRTIVPRRAVVMDFGDRPGGELSDTTRTVVVGSPSAGFERVYETVREAQAARATRSPLVSSPSTSTAWRGASSRTPDSGSASSTTGHGTASRCTSLPYIVEGNEVRARHDVLRRARRLLRG